MSLENLIPFRYPDMTQTPPFEDVKDFVIQILVPRQLTDLRILKTQDFNPVHGCNRYIWGGSGIHNIHYEESENTSDVVYNKKINRSFDLRLYNPERVQKNLGRKTTTS